MPETVLILCHIIFPRHTPQEEGYGAMPLAEEFRSSHLTTQEGYLKLQVSPGSELACS